MTDMLRPGLGIATTSLAAAGSELVPRSVRCGFGVPRLSCRPPRKPVELRSHLGKGAPFFAQIVPEVAEILPDVGPPPPMGAEGGRFRLFDAAATFLRNAAARQPLSVFGREFSLPSLARVSEIPAGELLDHSHENIAADVVAEIPGTPGRLRFTHALIRDVIYQHIPAGQRLRLHQRTSEVLEAFYR